MHVVDIFNLTPDQVIKNSRPATTYMLCSRRCSRHRAVSTSLALCRRAPSGLTMHDALLYAM